MNKLTSLSDQQLIEIWPKENDMVFAEIYNRYWDKLLAVAYNRLGDLFDAEECVQDVFCKFWGLRNKFELTSGNLNNYLSRSIRNQVFTVLYARNRQKQNDDKLPVVEDINIYTPEKHLIIQELNRQFDLAINALPTQCRIVFLLKREEGLSINEIAEKLDISANTVKSHLKKANRDIRNNTELLTIIVIYFTLLQNK
ncbi:RNA polymerase sigma factor [Sphingobacterium composti Ten et al. 2007 non Yoo et al. 2007]|uniref:RNA polymerase sigma factor n=1 Tax=Sphingobacterium composti TaxID=363260 RepID=UPI00135811FA|nr:RNA polymerase sigma-70 factor [Sphingobacterium composti Ten et al. 2007 non Yoo et al. 2007]